MSNVYLLYILFAGLELDLEGADLLVSRELVLVLVLALLVLTTRQDVSPLDTPVNRNKKQHIFLEATININQRR